jgi:hypothetical protein
VLGRPTKFLHFAIRTTDCKVIGSLEVEPELRSRVERLRQQPSRLGGNASLSANQLIDSLKRYSDVLGESYLRLAKRNEELLAKNLSRMRRDSVLGLHV